MSVFFERHGKARGMGRAMHNRNLLLSAAALGSACLISSFTGCSSSSGGSPAPAGDSGTASDSSTVDTGTPGDSSTPTDSSTGDTGTSANDSGTEGGTTATLDCTSGTFPTGTPIYATTTSSIQGVTSDGQVLLYDSSGSLSSLPIAGGTPTMISAYDNSGLYVSGSVVFYSHNVSTTSPVTGPVLEWTSAGGPQTLTTSGTAEGWQSSIGGGYIAVSTDGNYIAYTDNASGTKADVYVATSAGANATKLLSGVYYNGTDCNLDLQFAGDTLVVGYCPSEPGDASALAATVAAYSGATWTTVQTLSSAAFYGLSVNKAGTMVAYTTSGGQYVQALGTNTTPTLIDAAGEGGATFTTDGLSLIYYRTTGIYRSTLTSPAPAEIVAGSFGGTLSVSSDDNWLLTYENASTTFSDMYMTSTAAGSTLTTLCATETAALFGDAFTIDVSHALYFCNITTLGEGYVGDFDQAPVAMPSSHSSVAKVNVWQENATNGAKVLYNPGYLGKPGVDGTADIDSIDLSTSTTAATTVVSEADANYFLSADRSTLIYSFSACPTKATAGIYTMPVP
jgi:hypothetical protein